MFTKAPTLPQLVGACPPLLIQHQQPPQQQQQQQQQHLPVAPRRPGAMRADHQLLRRHCRTQPQLLLARGGTLTPVAQVLPVKRPAPTPAYDSDKDDCDYDDAVAAAVPPSPKLARRYLPGTAAAGASPLLPATCIATNPFYRRRSQQQQLQDPPVASAAAADLASTPSRLFAIADVAFPTTLLLSTATPAATPLEKPAPLPASVQRDSQTSPTLPSTPHLRGAGGGGGMSLTSWVRTARCRLAARLRRSLSASRVDVSDMASAASADAPTPKRLQQQLGAGGKRKRHASLQRLVQRLTAGSPLSASGAAAAANASRTPLASTASLSPSVACGGGVTGRVLQLLPDGSRTVRLQRPRGGKFGFFVARQQDGVHLTRFNDQATQLRYRCVISVGDQILEIEGLSTASMELADMHGLISDRRSLVMRVRSPCGSAW